MKIGVLDIGGTFIKSALYDSETGLHKVKETPTPACEGGAAIMEEAKKLLREFGKMDAIGISTAGQVDTEQGMIRYANPNIPDYTGTRIREILGQEFGVPVAVDNDVNMAALGEAHLGAGRGEAEFLCLTYGTGIGGAIIRGGEVYHGSCYSAAEFGSIITHGEAHKANGFPAGIYEKYASTAALVRRGMAQDPTLENGKIIFSRLAEPEVKSLVDDWIGEILLGLSCLIHVFNPSCIVLGGGVMSQPYILNEIQKRIEDYVMPSFLNVSLKRAELGNHAGLFGAAIAAKQMFLHTVYMKKMDF